MAATDTDFISLGAKHATDDQFTALGATPFAGDDEFVKLGAAPASSATGDFIKRVAKAAVEGTGNISSAIERLGERAATAIPNMIGAPGLSDMLKLKQQRDIAAGKYTQQRLDASNAENPLASLAGGITTDQARDSGLAATGANIVGSLLPVVAAGPAAPIALASQIAEGERQRAVAQGESEDVANARFDLGLAVGLPVALTPLGIGGRAVAGPIERIATKAAIGGALGFGGDAALQGVQQREFDAKESLLNTAMGAGGAAFMGLRERPQGVLAKMAGAPDPAINHEANIAAIADASGKPIDQVRSDYYAERGVTVPAPAATEAAPDISTQGSSVVERLPHTQEVADSISAPAPNPKPIEENADSISSSGPPVRDAAGAAPASEEVAGGSAAQNSVAPEARLETAPPAEENAILNPTAETVAAPAGLADVNAEAGKDLRTPPATPNFATDSADKIDAWEAANRKFDADAVVAVFGEDKAKEYNKLQRQANGSNNERADAASAKIAEMESGLSKSQEDTLFGKNLPDSYIHPDDARELRNTVADIDSASNVGELARSSSRLIQSALRASADGKPLEGRNAELTARVMRRAKEIGVSPQTLVKAAFAYRASIEGHDVFELAGVTPDQFGKFISETAPPSKPATAAPALPSPTVKIAPKSKPLGSQMELFGANGQGGFIDKRVLLAFGRSAIGGTAGYFTGDTDEEKLRNSIIGAGLAFGLPHVADALLKTPAGKSVRDLLTNEARDFWKRADPLHLLPSQAVDALGNVKPLRALVRETFGNGTAAERAISGQGAAIARDLDRSIAGTAAQRGSVKRLVQAYLTGDSTAKQQIGPQLPAPVYAQALRARYFVDGLTDQLITRGVVQGNMVQTFLSNLGQYMRRSYEIFSNPSYNTSQSDPIFKAKTDAAIDAVHQEMITKAMTSATPPPVLPARYEAESVIAALIDKHTRDAAQDFLYGRGQLAGKDVSVLMKKQDLLPEIRALLGEISDPVFNISETGKRMSRLLEADRTQKNIVQLGVDLGLFKNRRDLQFSRELATTDRHSNYNGLFAEPHIADAFSKTAAGGKIAGLGSFMGEVLSRQGIVAKALGPATYAAKYGKTVLSPISYVPHALHGAVANVLNGNFRFDATGHALLLGAEEIGALRHFFPNTPNRAALQAEISYLTKQRVFGQDIIAADLADVLDKNLYRKLRDPVTKTLSFPALPDRLSDQTNKYVAFKSEAAKLAWALPGTAPEAIADMAAKRVRDTLPTYEGIPEVVKGASRAAMLSQFVSFPIELLRNTAQSYNYGLQDIAQGTKTKNSRLVSLGAQRLATMTAGLAAVSAYGISKMAQTQAGVTDQQDRALRELSPHWIKSAELLYDSPVVKDPKTGNPTISYTNMSYLMAYSEIMQPLNMAIKELQAGGEVGGAVKKAMETIKERLVGSSLVLPAVAGAISGVDLEKKRPIPASDIDPTVKDRAAFLWNKLAPGIAQWGQQTAKALSDQEASYGKKFNLSNQLLRLGGVRRETTDVPQSFYYRARDLADQLDRANFIYRGGLNKNFEQPQLDRLYGYAENARKQTLTQLRAAYDASMTLGMSEDSVIKAMNSARIDPRDILAVADNNYRPQDKGGKPTASELFAQMAGQTLEQKQAQISAIYKNDPGMGRTILELFRQDVRGMTEKDKTIGRLGVNNGERADYLREQLANQPTPQARQQYIQDMARRRLLSPLIMNQMASPPK